MKHSAPYSFELFCRSVYFLIHSPAETNVEWQYGSHLVRNALVSHPHCLAACRVVVTALVVSAAYVLSH